MSAWSGLMRKAKAAMLRHAPFMITCGEFDAFVVDYFDDALTPAQKRVFEWHLKLCPACLRYLWNYRMMIALEKAVFEQRDAAVPKDVPDDLVHAILKARAADG